MRIPFPHRNDRVAGSAETLHVSRHLSGREIVLTLLLSFLLG